MTQNLTTQEVEEVKNQKKQKEVGAMELQNVELFDQPIIVSPIVLEEYEEKIVDGVKIKIEKKKDHSGEYYDVRFREYVVRIYGLSPYDARMALYALLMCEKQLLAKGFVEGVIDWEERDWEIWDPYRIFTYGQFKIFREGNYEREEGDSLIDLEVRRIFAPYSDNKLKLYIKAFMMPAPHIE
jgi:hypothetical protein